ncbi:unnamed protein product [Cylicostephanus goldi]|uniref:Uncharacterized protein n=1 Tax=Cylicostephanus goldi TaxID=71465 RepID=A0A3P7PUJ9_CYLGO|nr:unnamed protein product [Cylicostephanus goldi]
MMNNIENMKSRLPDYILTPAKKDPCALDLKAGEIRILAGVFGHGANYNFVRSNRCGMLKRRKWKKYLEYFKNEDCLREDEEYFSYE